MTESKYFPLKIFISQEAEPSPITARVLKNAPGIPHEVIDDPQDLIEDIRMSRHPVEQGKQFLLLTVQKGEFIKPCPCTPHYLGCNYFIINLETNCPLDCNYCILQSYLSNPLVTVHVNHDDLWQELAGFTARQDRIFRIGTGELADSLALDHLTENSRILISRFRDQRKAIFELKTKTTNIDHVLEQEPAPNIVVSWSLNTPKLAQEHETGAPPVEQRLQAAKKITRVGFRVGFHFDPLIRYPGWEEDYEEVVRLLFEAVDPERIAWMSLGSLRFPPDFISVINRRFPTSKIFHDEFIRGRDGKFRYFKPLRLELYHRVARTIKKTAGTDVPLYFCMESRDVWQAVLKKMPRDEQEVEHSLTHPAAYLEEF